ncbi:MFS transporter [Actinomycetospora sp. NBRC 106375]|uniref:MFS transporter n=1 Tax=Actinomycetospora sp. NBRC 106375 TaxID=3032207 RepID=UPI0024A5AE6C|nr:MFS transporter [Actinomycetospora sp. NBRC 106375]GLZ45511.1 MFS transporter [Actinomycetospora sp. NBRC 106375]
MSGSPPPMRRIAIASMTGTVIEFYDFFIYGTAAALVFNKVFFPSLGAAAGTALALATFGVAFVARPFGSVLFGHFGDRLGRKRTLVTTLLLMGLSTLAIGLLPTTGAIGVAAPIILVLLRVLQGLAVGGEWAGATLLTAENSPAKARGKFALFPQLGPSLAFALASATFLATALTMSNEAFLAWGWRVPFIASVLLVAVGLYVRLAITETAAFSSHRKAGVVDTTMPVAAVLRTQTKEVLLGAGSTMAVFAFFYIGVTYLTTYGTQQLELPRTTVLAMGIVGGLVFAATTIAGAILSDRVGRRRMIIIGNSLAVAGGIVAFPILDIGTGWSFGLGLSVVLGVVGFAYGPQGAQLPELFPTRYRYTGAGMAYNLAGVLGGGVVPLIATALVATFASSFAIGLLLAGLSVVSLLCTLALPDTGAESIPDAAPEAALA